MEIADFTYIIVSRTTQKGAVVMGRFEVFYYDRDTRRLLGRWDTEGLTVDEIDRQLEDNRDKILDKFRASFRGK